MTDNFVLVTDLDHDIIYQISLDGKQVLALNIPEAFIPAMVRYNTVQRYIYWTDVGSRKIIRKRLADNSTEEVFKASKLMTFVL